MASKEARERKLKEIQEIAAGWNQAHPVLAYLNHNRRINNDL